MPSYDDFQRITTERDRLNGILRATAEGLHLPADGTFNHIPAAAAAAYDATVNLRDQLDRANTGRQRDQEQLADMTATAASYLDDRDRAREYAADNDVVLEAVHAAIDRAGYQSAVHGPANGITLLATERDKARAELARVRQQRDDLAAHLAHALTERDLWITHHTNQRAELGRAQEVIAGTPGPAGPCCQAASDSEGNAHEPGCCYLLGMAAGRTAAATDIRTHVARWQHSPNVFTKELEAMRTAARIAERSDRPGSAERRAQDDTP